MTTDHDDDPAPPEPPAPGPENLVHFNPWRDFNDAAPQIDVFGDEPNPAQIAPSSWRRSSATPMD